MHETLLNKTTISNWVVTIFIRDSWVSCSRSCRSCEENITSTYIKEIVYIIRPIESTATEHILNMFGGTAKTVQFSDKVINPCKALKWTLGNKYMIYA